MNFHNDNFIGFGDSSANSFDLLDVDIAIVGAGVAGLYAAYSCDLAGIDSLLIESLMIPGGQCSALYPEKTMYGTPGFSNIKAKDFIENLKNQCLENSKKQLFGHKVENISKNSDGFLLTARNTCSLQEVKISAKYIILTTGIGDMKPNIPSTISGIDEIEKTSDFIQHYCLNLNLYKDKNVIIAGGGDSAIDFATNISNIAKSVTIIHRRSKFTCEPIKLNNIASLEKSGKINLVLEHNVFELKEENGKKIVKAKDKESKDKNFETDHIIFCYGFAASSCSLFGLKNFGLKMENNLINVDINTMETSIENCYAAGDVVNYKNKKKNIVPCFFEADRAVRTIKNKLSQE